MSKAEAIRAAPTPGGETVQGDGPTQQISDVKHCKPASDGCGHPAITPPEKFSGMVQEVAKARQTFTVQCLYAVTPFWTGEGLLSIGIFFPSQLDSVSESGSSKTEVTS